MADAVSGEQGDIESRLYSSEALLRGHFLLSSGRHSDQYIQCARLLSHPQHAQYAGEALARLWRDRGHGGTDVGIDVVVGPALGGIIIAHEVARALGVRALFAERESGVLSLRRGFVLAPGERVLIVEDVVTTGGSARETATLCQSLGAVVAGYAAIVERGEGHGLSPLVALWQVRPALYEAADCPLCKSGLAAQKPGSRALPR